MKKVIMNVSKLACSVILVYSGLLAVNAVYAETEGDIAKDAFTQFDVGLDKIKAVPIDPDGKMRFDVTNKSFHALGRSRLEYKEFVLIADQVDFDAVKGRANTIGNVILKTEKAELHADRMAVDIFAKEVEGEGNLLLITEKGTVHAERARYNYGKDTGEVYGVEGKHEYIYFGTTKRDVREPALKMLSDKEIVVSKAHVTTCDFPVPHYYVTAREFIIYVNDRIFARDAVMYVRGIPLLYFPAYSHSLSEGSPWSFSIGYASKLGGILRLGYHLRHYIEEPSFTDETQLVKKHDGILDLRGDWFYRRGIGHNLKYCYSLFYGKHKGEIDLYGIWDNEREVRKEHEVYRWSVDTKIRSSLGGKSYLQITAEGAHDPEVHYDFLDDFEEDQKGRMSERRARAAVTSMNDSFYGRILVEGKDRIGRDRNTDFSEPGSDDLDFDEDPLSEFDPDDEGLPRKRYGRISEKTPQVSLGSSYLPLGSFPLYWMSDVNVVNALDSGLNTLDTEDDSRVQGLDAYQQLMCRFRLSRSTSLLLKAGAGGGYLHRTDEGETVLVGGSQRNMEDVEEAFAYVDSEARLTTSLTDSLSAWVKHSFRTLTDDSLPEYYESIGRIEVKDDMYPFRDNRHWVDTGINFDLGSSGVSLSLNGGKNLQSESDIYSNEPLHYASLGASYSTSPTLFRLSGTVTYEERQIRDPSDIDEFEQGIAGVNLGGTLFGKEQRWWLKTNVNVLANLDDDPLGRARGFDLTDPEYERRKSKASYSEEDTVARVGMAVGGKVGSKYVLELGAEYDDDISDFSSGYLVVKRDLHDFTAHLRIGVSNDIFDRDDDDERGSLHWDVRFGLELNVPTGKKKFNAFSIETLGDSTKGDKFLI